MSNTVSNNGSMSNSDGTVSNNGSVGNSNGSVGHSNGSMGHSHGAVGNNGGMGHSRSGSVGGDTVIGDIGDIAASSVSHVVVDGLSAAVGQGHGVGAGGGVAVPVLVLGKVGAAVVVVHAVLVGVHGGLVVDDGGGGVLGQGTGNQGRQNKGDLQNKSNCIAVDCVRCSLCSMIEVDNDNCLGI